MSAPNIVATDFEASSLKEEITQSGVRICMVRSDRSGVEIVVANETDIARLDQKFGDRIRQLGSGTDVTFIHERKSYF